MNNIYENIKLNKRSVYGIYTIITYIFTLLLSRLTVFLIEADVNIPFLGYNVVNGYHIHHFSYGIMILVVLAFYSLFFRMNRVRDVYLIFGLALGLIFDEFGIWLKLDPEYNQNVSYIAMSIVFLILSMIVLLGVKYPVQFGHQEKPNFDEIDV
jgi:hypothetical protein